MTVGDNEANPSSPATSFCLATAWACELCGGRHAQVVIRLTSHGPACLDLCASCRQLPEPIVLRTPTAANEHREHLTRARDRGELP